MEIYECDPAKDKSLVDIVGGLVGKPSESRYDPFKEAERIFRQKRPSRIVVDIKKVDEGYYATIYIPAKDFDRGAHGWKLTHEDKESGKK